VAVIERAAFQPTIRWESTSVTDATYVTSGQVEQFVKSAADSWFGAGR
jgi:hypothetical protein